MYRELGPEDHRRILGIDAGELPDVLLLVGAFDVHASATRFASYLEEAKPMRRFPAFLAGSRGMRVALAACFGGPMAANHVHSWCAAGVPLVVQLGWYGALQPGSQIGDIVVPRHAERQDSVSDWYLPKGILADATPELVSGICARLEQRGIPTSDRAIFSTPALLAESREVIVDWSRHGWQGVDMETASTFAVAKALGARRAAALIRYDDLVAEEDSVADDLPAPRRRLLRAREAEVVAAVLEIADELRDV